VANTFLTSDSKVQVPADITKSIFKNARESSVVARLSRATPLSLSGTTIPVYDGEVNMGVVAEGGRKPVEKPGTSMHTITPHKMAAIVVVSDELIRQNPGEVFDNIQADLADSVGRALDSLVLYGTDARTGAKVSGQSAVLDTTKTVTLAGNDYKTAVLSGFELVGEKYDVDGIAADSRAKAPLLSTVNEVQFGLPNLSEQSFSVAGVRTEFARTVGRNGGADKDTRLILGDWDRLAYGFASGIEITRSSEATIVDEGGEVISLFQHNLVALRVETFIGATVLDKDAFAVVNAASAGA